MAIFASHDNEYKGKKFENYCIYLVPPNGEE